MTTRPKRHATPAGPARKAAERLVAWIRAFENDLDPAQEVALGLAGSDAGILQIEEIGYSDPDLITFTGTDEGGLRTELIQHVSQLNVILRAVPSADPDEAPRRIGFTLTPRWVGGESGDASAGTTGPRGSRHA